MRRKIAPLASALGDIAYTFGRLHMYDRLTQPNHQHLTIYSSYSLSSPIDIYDQLFIPLPTTCMPTHRAHAYKIVHLLLHDMGWHYAPQHADAWSDCAGTCAGKTAHARLHAHLALHRRICQIGWAPGLEYDPGFIAGLPQVPIHIPKRTSNTSP